MHKNVIALGARADSMLDSKLSRFVTVVPYHHFSEGQFARPTTRDEVVVI